MMWLALLVFSAVAAARLGLSWLNLRHLQREGHVVPAVLAGQVDSARLARMSAYTAARARLGMVQSVLSASAVGGFLFAGGLGWYDAWAARLARSFVGNGVVFVTGLALASTLLSVPFQLYSDFRLEARYGFNRKTARLWWGDWLKSTWLSLLILAALSAGAFALIKAAPHSWWLWVSALVGSVSLLLTVLSPSLIEPLFYRMEPLKVEGLRDGIRAMTERAGVHVGRVLQVDASRRSSHSNAYFTGLGRQKRVVLFDTLLAQMSEPQILAVLAHELGHWKKQHVLLRMIAMQVLLVLSAYLAFRLAPNPWLPGMLGLGAASVPARLVILAAAASLLLFPLTPVFAAWSRHDEREADRFAVELQGAPLDLADALAKLGGENLANLHPHPLYAAFYYSHPPLAERIGTLRANAAEA
jgi:STE24 endopeptidase